MRFVMHEMSETIIGVVKKWLWKTEDLAGRWTLDRRFTPAMPPAARDAAYAGWQRAVERSRAWAHP